MKTGTLWKLEESQFQSEIHRWEKLVHPYTHEGKNTPVEFSVTRHELAQTCSPSQMEILFLSAGLISWGSVPQKLQCHSSCSLVSCSLWPCVGGTCACLEKTLAIEPYPETNNSMCFCCYGCVSVVFPHLPSASKFSLFAVCPSIHSRVCPFFTLPCPLCFRFSEVAELRIYHTSGIAFLACPIYPEPVCVLGLWAPQAVQGSSCSVMILFSTLNTDPCQDILELTQNERVKESPVQSLVTNAMSQNPLVHHCPF